MLKIPPHPHLKFSCFLGLPVQSAYSEYIDIIVENITISIFVEIRIINVNVDMNYIIKMLFGNKWILIQALPSRQIRRHKIL